MIGFQQTVRGVHPTAGEGIIGGESRTGLGCARLRTGWTKLSKIPE